MSVRRLAEAIARFSITADRAVAIVEGRRDPGRVVTSCNRRCDNNICPTPMTCSGLRGRHLIREGEEE